jgi:hypothetical protein
VSARAVKEAAGATLSPRISSQVPRPLCLLLTFECGQSTALEALLVNARRTVRILRRQADVEQLVCTRGESDTETTAASMFVSE